jgi:hypothetical protein
LSIDRSFELAIRVDVDRRLVCNDRCGHVIAKVKSGDRDGFFALPMANAEVAVLGFVALYSCGDSFLGQRIVRS